MRRKIIVALLTGITIINFVYGGPAMKRPEKKGILLVAFGTSDKEAQEAFINIDRLARKRFPDIPVKWAFTSNIVRRKLLKQGPVPPMGTDSPQLALAKMQEEGFTHIAIQSLHFAAGAEFHKMYKQASKFMDGPAKFDQIEIGRPLLVSREDLNKLIDAVVKIIPEERKADEAVVFMGHGNSHGRCDLVLVATAEKLEDKDKNFILGTVEGAPNLEDVTGKLKASGCKKAYLIPLMAVAGDHAKNDLAGEEEDSWKSVFTKMGIACVPVLKGLGEYDVVAQLWLDHLEESLKALKSSCSDDK